MTNVPHMVRLGAFASTAGLNRQFVADATQIASLWSAGSPVNGRRRPSVFTNPISLQRNKMAAYSVDRASPLKQYVK